MQYTARNKYDNKIAGIPLKKNVQWYSHLKLYAYVENCFAVARKTTRYTMYGDDKPRDMHN